jgi:hypothetical protein
MYDEKASMILMFTVPYIYILILSYNHISQININMKECGRIIYVV